MQKEINKLLKRVEVEKLKNNHKECIELYNIIGGLYSDIGSYDEAVHYHDKALEAAKTLGDRLGTAMALRYIGESQAALGQFYQAIVNIKKYLDLAQKMNNKVEIQRAHTTLGRMYLMQAQDMKDNSHVIEETVKNIAQEAEKRFQTALNLAESVKDQVDGKEFAQMKSGLLINIGLVKDICGRHGDTVVKLKEAIEICKSAKLKEDLYRCQIILTSIFRQRNNIERAAEMSQHALKTAKQIGKKLLLCDAYIEQGLVKICQCDFKGAKRTFAQAYLEKSPSEEDHSKAIRLTKLSHLISEAYEMLTSKQNNELSNASRMKLCDKLGDLFIAINSYKLAIEFYRRAFTEAKLCSKPKSELARILYSIAETYADDGQFEHAMVCYEKELTYRNGNDAEQCQSLIKIAHMHEYLNHEPEKVCESYEKALEKAGNMPKLMYNVVKDYVQYMEKKSINSSRYHHMKSSLSNLKSFPEVVDEGGAEEPNELEDEISNIDDIITDDEDNDEVMMVGRRKSRGTKKFKPNEVGETPLHDACIKGDLKRVKSLLSQGHEVNPRDNAGWIPLHEACNHGHVDIVKYLVENGADVSNRGLKGMSPLHDAATNGHFEIMRILIENGANVIALTDTGETVLSCFRDYKKRSASEMSNRDLSEYKMMEAELLNIMDKRGFNLMEANMKNLGKRNNSSSPLGEVRPKPRNNLMLNQDQLSNPMKDYKDVISNLKRKRVNEEPKETVKKTNLPPTIITGSNTSAPTKEWLIDDISRDKRVDKRRSNLQELLETEYEFSEDEIETVPAPSPVRRSKNIRKSPDSKGNQSKPVPTKSTTSKTNLKRCLLDSEDESDAEQDDDVLIIGEESREPEILQSPDPFDDFTNLSSPRLNRKKSSSLITTNSRNSSSNQFNLLEQPLVVTIDDRKLLVPIKDEYATVKWLKESIIERYSSLVGEKPNISLTPISNPSCLLFDGDFCQDVIKENVIATIDSWQLGSIPESYSNGCAKANVVAFDWTERELSRIDQIGNKLDLAYTRFPRSHIKPIAMAIARRDFTFVNLTGSFGLFDSQQNGREMLDAIATWGKLNHLSLKCVGLRRAHFETICSAMKFPELKSLDLSVNAIAYKCKIEFKKHIESLRQACPKLKRLDMRKNHLQFVRKSICDPSSELDLSRLLDLMPSESGDLEILGADQNEYSVYSA